MQVPREEYSALAELRAGAQGQALLLEKFFAKAEKTKLVGKDLLAEIEQEVTNEKKPDKEGRLMKIAVLVVLRLIIITSSSVKKTS